MNRLYILFRSLPAFLPAFLLLTSYPDSAAQDIDSVLSEIERNNTELQALRKRNEAEKYGYRAERSLDAPEVGFDYLWGSPADIGTRKDISVTQRVDFAAISGAKGRLNTALVGLSDEQYRMDRQRVLLEAKQLCINLIYRNIMASELSARLELAAQVDSYYRDMLERGEVDRIEANQAHLAYLSQKNALSRNEIERDNLLAELARLNGGRAVEFDISEYADTEMLPTDFETWYAEVSQCSPELAYAHQNVAVGESGMRNARMSNLPSLTAGYMAELVKGSNFRGLTLGLSIPLWSARSRIRQANASYEASKLAEQDAASQMYARLKGLYDRTCGLRDVADELSASMEVSGSSMSLSEQKLKAGETSLLENIMELSLYYSLADEAYMTARDYHLSLAELLAWEL